MNYSILARGISIDRLQTFCRVVETGSLVNAAGGDPTRQSQYSRQIKQLEEALEKPLFTREGRAMRLNEDGRQLALMTNAYFQALQEFADGNEAPVLRIGAGESVLEAFVYPRFKEIRAALPILQFEFRSLATSEISRLLGTGELDAGLIREDAKSPEFETTRVGRMEFELLVPRRLLPEREIAGIQRVQSLPMACLAGNGRFVRLLAELIRIENLPAQTVVRADSFSKVTALAISGGLAAFVPSQLAGEFPPEDFARYKTVQFDSLTRNIALISATKVTTMRSTLSKNLHQLTSVLKTI